MSSRMSCSRKTDSAKVALNRHCERRLRGKRRLARCPVYLGCCVVLALLSVQPHVDKGPACCEEGHKGDAAE